MPVALCDVFMLGLIKKPLRVQRYNNFLIYARERWTFWHGGGQNDTQGGQNGTKVDKMAGMEGLARRLQFKG